MTHPHSHDKYAAQLAEGGGNGSAQAVVLQQEVPQAPQIANGVRDAALQAVTNKATGGWRVRMGKGVRQAEKGMS